jgi:predicted transcriptional regulator
MTVAAQSPASPGMLARQMLPVLSDEDNKLVANLQAIGIPRTAAMVLIAMERYGESKPVDSRWVEWVANLRQPEVSIAMKWLIAEKVVSSRAVANESIGRPHQIYWISRVVGCFIQDKIDQRRQEFEASIVNLQGPWTVH